MADQLAMTGGSDRARHTDPDTSKDAADDLGDQARNHQALLRALVAAEPYGLTDYEAADQALEHYGASGMREAVRRRMGELRGQLEWAYWTGERSERRGISRPTAKGLEVAKHLPPTPPVR